MTTGIFSIYSFFRLKIWPHTYNVGGKQLKVWNVFTIENEYDNIY